MGILSHALSKLSPGWPFESHFGSLNHVAQAMALCCVGAMQIFLQYIKPFMHKFIAVFKRPRNREITDPFTFIEHLRSFHYVD